MIGKDMIGIEINIDNLDSHVGAINSRRQAAQLLEKTTEIEQTGMGLVENELVAYNEVCNTLLKDLDSLYQKIGMFLACTRDGVVTSDEYTAMLIKNGAVIGNGGEAQ